METADLVTFTVEVPNAKLRFLCSALRKAQGQFAKYIYYIIANNWIIL